ncbi:hypothetical protein Bca52824_021699 [Brassica carinata]|uniref:DUF4283 domain-containing protein n=1 Tax=Brassica carinata TaxID=52824 RepID=A0A8X7VF09_BRACI|nr:hypothetical protein Bca52824_021699 [Brassica carinata]
MADMLHKAIVFDENSCSLLGRLLNPECQSMARMIDYMPTAWRVYGRVRGIALSRDRFQFIFQREEDLQTVLNDRPWSYNHWAMVIDRWTANPPEDYLQYMELWIRIRHIPMNLFTIDTMFALAKEIGKVEEIAYDPKVSHTKDYIRAKILFNVDNPAKAFRKLEVCKDSTATIEFEYEKIHKLCFHCRRLTHEKYRCPLLRRGAQSAKTVPDFAMFLPKLQWTLPLDGPPGFPLLFPELSNEDRKMALLYISHADETERRARIQRVQQGIEENKAESSSRLTKITKELDKGKGHVFSYQNPASDKGPHSGSALLSSSRLYLRDKEEDDSESSASLTSACSEPVLPTGFRLGPSSGGRVSGTQGVSKAPRKRPSSWKRRAGANSGVTASVSPTVAVSNGGNAKRKPSALDLPENKSSKVSDSTRRDVWDRIVSLGLNRDEAWILAGDFNELLSNDEKSGGAIRTDSSFWDFRNMVQNCKLREVRYTGNCLSWGGWRENVWVQCRLDRSFGNSEWFSLFPKSNMDFALEKEDSKGRFFFDKRMLSREGFEDLVRSSWEGRPEDRSCTMERIGRCRRRIMSWKKNADMNSRNKIIRLKAALEAEVSKASPSYNNMKKIKQELAEALREEELFWRQKFSICLSCTRRYTPLVTLKIAYVSSSCNLIANLIAVSVTRDHRYQSYVARNGPAWLATQIGQEALA